MIQKGQTLDGAFNVMDSNDDGFITYDEFRDAVQRTFRVRVKDEELLMYWRRLNLNKQAQLSRAEFYHRFGLYFSDDTNMRVTQQRLGYAQNEYNRGKFGDPNQGAYNREAGMQGLGGPELNKTSGQVKSSTNQGNCLSRQDINIIEIVRTLIRRIVKHVEQNNTDVETFLSSIDTDKSGYLSRIELRMVLSKLNLDLLEEELNDLIQYFDMNQDDKVSMEEFKAALRSGVYQELQKTRQATASTEPSNEERRVEVWQVHCRPPSKF